MSKISGRLYGDDDRHFHRFIVFGGNAAMIDMRHLQVKAPIHSLTALEHSSIILLSELIPYRDPFISSTYLAKSFIVHCFMTTLTPGKVNNPFHHS